jgi:protein involved in polysaccharide export with SLBB domain
MQRSLATVVVLVLIGACRSASAPPSAPRGLTYVIEGQVKHVGVRPFQDDLTLLEAVTAAQPLDGSCDLQHVRLVRTAVDRPLDFVIDLAAMQRTGDSTNNVLVRPGDVILVPARPGS